MSPLARRAAMLALTAQDLADRGCDAVEDQGARQADGVDPASLAGAVDTGRAGTERMDHRTLRLASAGTPVR